MLQNGAHPRPLQQSATLQASTSGAQARSLQHEPTFGEAGEVVIKILCFKPQDF